MVFKDRFNFEMLFKKGYLLDQIRFEFSFAIFVLPVWAASLLEWGIYC